MEHADLKIRNLFACEHNEFWMCHTVECRGEAIDSCGTTTKQIETF